MIYNKNRMNWSSILLFITTSTFFLVIYIYQKNNIIYHLQENQKLNKKLIFYKNQVSSNKGSIIGLKRADRIREIAEEELNMYFPQPESLIVIINE
tara:strand:- start:152 stop:439 length:288 start_codon:yes stop_codon:yes gene_type:complete